MSDKLDPHSSIQQIKSTYPGQIDCLESPCGSFCSLPHPKRHRVVWGLQTFTLNGKRAFTLPKKSLGTLS